MIAFMVLLAMTNRVAELQGKICSLQLQEQNIQNEIHAAKIKLVQELKLLYPIVYFIVSRKKASYGGYAYGATSSYIAIFTTREKANLLLGKDPSRHLYVVGESSDELFQNNAWLNLDPKYIDLLGNDIYHLASKQ